MCVCVCGYRCVFVYVCVWMCVRVCFGAPAFSSMHISCFPLNLILVIYIDVRTNLLEASDCNTVSIKTQTFSVKNPLMLRRSYT